MRPDPPLLFGGMVDVGLGSASPGTAVPGSARGSLHKLVPQQLTPPMIWSALGMNGTCPRLAVALHRFPVAQPLTWTGRLPVTTVEIKSNPLPLSTTTNQLDDQPAA